MSESASPPTSRLRRALRDPATLRSLAHTALSSASTAEEREGALALLELAGEDGTAPAPVVVATPAPIPPVVAHMSQLLSAEERAALAQFEGGLDHAQRAAGEAAEARWDAFESEAFTAGRRPQEAALAATTPADDYWAWLRPEAGDVDVRQGYGDGDGSTTVAPTP